MDWTEETPAGVAWAEACGLWRLGDLDEGVKKMGDAYDLAKKVRIDD